MSRTFKDDPHYVQTERGFARKPKRRERYDNTLFGDGYTKVNRIKNSDIDHDHLRLGRVVTRVRYFYDETGDMVVHCFTKKQKKEAEALARKFDNKGILYRQTDYESWDFNYLGDFRPMYSKYGEGYINNAGYKVIPYEIIKVDEYADRCTANEELVLSNSHRYAKGMHRTLDGLIAPCSPEYVYVAGSYYDYHYDGHGEHAREHNRMNRKRANAVARKAAKSYAVDGSVPEEHYDDMTYDMPNGWCC